MPLDKDVRRYTLGMITYGLYVVLSRYSDEVVGGTITWLSQASFEPPLVMLAVKRDSGLNEVARKSGYLVINIVDKDNLEVAQAFFKGARLENNKINGYEFEEARFSKAPIIKILSAWMEGKVKHIFDDGDHSIFIIEIVDAGYRRSDFEPVALKETPWRYGG